MEKIIALIKKYTLGKLTLGSILSDFDKVEADLKSFGMQQLEAAQRIKAKADKLECKREACLEAKEKAERVLGRIQALTE